MKISAWALAVVLLGSAGARADIIESKNGQKLEGLITRENERQIAINVDGLELTMNREEIARVEKKPLPPKPKPAPAPPQAQQPAPAAEAAATTAAETAAPQPAAMPTEFPIMVFDERNWKMGSQGMSEQGPIAEFVLEGESVENWSELITAQMFPGLQSKAMPVDFAYSARKDLLKACPAVDWRLLSVSQAEAMYEWTITGCQGQQDQMEIVRVIRGEQGMHLLHYAVKQPAIPDEERLKWIERLGRARLAKK